MEASHFDANTAYAAVDRHRLTDDAPYIYRTRDGGKTWQKITKGLPPAVYVQTVKEDPVRRGMLFAGTELAMWVSFNDGDDWQSLQLNLPPVSMRDVAVKGNDLIVATHGRGFWILDDISVLRQASTSVTAAEAFLFKPADAVIMPPQSDNGTPTQKDEAQAENPPNGAVIDYYLKAAPAGPIMLEIVDAQGVTFRRVGSDDSRATASADAQVVSPLWTPAAQPLATTPGMHRWVWDFRPTPLPGGRGGRGGAAGGGGGGGRGGPPPAGVGNYTVRLTVNGTEYTQPLVVKGDPRSAR